MNRLIYLLVVVSLFFAHLQADSSAELARELNQVLSDRKLRGIQLEVTKDGNSLFYHNVGTKNNNDPIDADTIFQVASLSKSFSSVAILQLVEKGLLNLNDTLSSIFGFEIKNPFYPETLITL
jgi:D-alanyl-D-alanine carboxypeptidase